MSLRISSIFDISGGFEWLLAKVFPLTESLLSSLFNQINSRHTLVEEEEGGRGGRGGGATVESK